MALMVDERGAFAGAITVEVIPKRIVGNIRDGREPEPEPVARELEYGSFAPRGSAAVRDVNGSLGANFEHGRYGTIGGVVLGALGREPEVGDEVNLGGYALRADETDGARVARITARREG